MDDSELGSKLGQSIKIRWTQWITPKNRCDCAKGDEAYEVKKIIVTDQRN